MANQSSAVVTFDFVAQSVRIVMRNDEPWFVAVDVCAALSIGNSRMALDRLDDDEKGVSSIDTLGGNQELSIINESGLYSLILTSRKPEAKKFKKWVTAEVLPAIRKTGRYVAAPAQEAPELVSGNDMRNLSRLVWLMTHQFRSQGAFVQTVIRRILRHGENAEKVLAETRALLAQSADDDLKEANDCLQRWSEQEIARFVERRPIGSNVLYPDATEPSLNL